MARTRHSSSSPATTGRSGPPALSVVQGGAWRLLVLAEIANFGMLRRHVGRTRADLLINDAVERARRALSAAAPQVVSRSSFELELLGAAREELEAHCDLLQAAFAQPFDLDGEQHHLELLLAGVASPVGGVEDVRLVEEVEDALVQARLEHRRVLRHLTQGRRAIDRIAIRRELPEALVAGQVFLQYQPKVHIRRQEIVSAEALVRWNHPTRGLILPSDFIPLAEQTQMIGPLTVWTLERVIADQRQLAADGHDLPVFINISGQLLGDTRFIDTACRMIAQSGARIGFEITETAMIRDPDSAIGHLKRIADVGVPIAIDDYGAGLSSLAYLKRLPATELKIDKMFVMELTSSNRDPLIVRSTIDLAHAMEMEVTAEGVETPAALALLSVMGCDMVQGFLISRPISIDAFRHYLHEQAGQPIELTGPGIKRPASFWKSA